MSDLLGDDDAARRKVTSAARYGAKWRAKNPDYQRNYFAKPENLEKHRLRMAAWRATPEGRAILVAQQAARRATEKYKESRAISRLLAAYRVRLAEHTAGRLVIKPLSKHGKPSPAEVAIAKHKQQKVRYHTDPSYNLMRRMSSAVRGSLRVGKSSKQWQTKWCDLVGYTAGELRAHIEKQFVPKMGWHNMPKWHVDHIVPLSSFTFQTAADPEFKAAWALTNLRPLWGPDNLSKRDRREHLL